MDNDDKKKSLMVGLLDHSQAVKKLDSTRKRFRRCRSAPHNSSFYEHAVTTDHPLGPHGTPSSNKIFPEIHRSLKLVLILLILYLSIGMLCFYLARHQIKGEKTNGIIDSVYFCIVTMTTVGYGDLVPDSTVAKLLACAFVFSGMALVGLILGKAADYIVEKQEILLVKTIHMREKVGPSDILKEVETNRVRYKFILTIILTIILLVALVITGTVFLVMVEDLDIVDAFYCVCSTITTLGYGDISFSSETGRLFAIFWILLSTLCMGQFFLCIAEATTESRQKSLVKWVLKKKMTNVDLEAADLDEDGQVGVAEFIVFKLREMGKISPEDISLVMNQFENLDVDQSGTLSLSDINLAQLRSPRK